MALTQMSLSRTEILWHVDTAKNKETKDWGLAQVSWWSSPLRRLAYSLVLVQLAPLKTICSWDPALSSAQRNQAVAHGQGLVWSLQQYRHGPIEMHPCTLFPRHAEPCWRSSEETTLCRPIYPQVSDCTYRKSSVGLQQHRETAPLQWITAYNSKFVCRNQTSPHGKNVFRVRLLGFFEAWTAKPGAAL